MNGEKGILADLQDLVAIVVDLANKVERQTGDVIVAEDKGVLADRIAFSWLVTVPQLRASKTPVTSVVIASQGIVVLGKEVDDFQVFIAVQWKVRGQRTKLKRFLFSFVVAHLKNERWHVPFWAILVGQSKVSTRECSMARLCDLSTSRGSGYAAREGVYTRALIVPEKTSMSYEISPMTY